MFDISVEDEHLAIDRATLVAAWSPALPDIEERLTALRPGVTVVLLVSPKITATPSLESTQERESL